MITLKKDKILLFLKDWKEAIILYKDCLIKPGQTARLLSEKEDVSKYSIFIVLFMAILFSVLFLSLLFIPDFFKFGFESQIKQIGTILIIYLLVAVFLFFAISIICLFGTVVYGGATWLIAKYFGSKIKFLKFLSIYNIFLICLFGTCVFFLPIGVYLSPGNNIILYFGLVLNLIFLIYETILTRELTKLSLIKSIISVIALPLIPTIFFSLLSIILKP